MDATPRLAASSTRAAPLACAIGAFAALMPPRLSVLIFHRVHARPDPLFPGEPDAEQFEALLRAVAASFRVLSLHDAVAALRDGTLRSRTLAITFDDGYADNATVALPVLERLGLHATFFVASGFLDGGRMFNDTVIEAVRGFDGEALDLRPLGLPVFTTRSWQQKRAAIDALLPLIKRQPLSERDATVGAIAAASRAAIPGELMMSSRQLRLVSDAGMEIGAHTIHHPILTQTTAAEAEAEICGGRERLEGIIGRAVRLFAYPNGKPRVDYDASHVALVRRLGFEAAVSTAWGAAGAGADPHQIPRFTPWDARPWKFCLRLAGNLRRGAYARA